MPVIFNNYNIAIFTSAIIETTPYIQQQEEERCRVRMRVIENEASKMANHPYRVLRSTLSTLVSSTSLADR